MSVRTRRRSPRSWVATIAVLVTTVAAAGGSAASAAPNRPAPAPGAAAPRTAAKIALALSPSSIKDDGSTSTATVTVTDAGGHGVAGQPVTVTSSRAGETVGRVIDQGDGIYTAAIRSSKLPEQATITAADGALSTTATLVQYGEPATIAVTLAPASISAGGRSTATVTIDDEDGAPVPGAALRVTSTLAGERIGPVTDEGDGTYTVTITGSGCAGQATITAAAGSASGVATLTQDGPPARIALALSPSSIAANGSSTSRATVTIEDAAGHGVAGEPVTIATSRPGEKVSDLTDEGNGAYTATITSSRTPGPATITATDGTLKQTAVLTQT